MDDKSYVARFSLQVAEFRGKFGRKGVVGGSSKNPTAGGSAAVQSPKGEDSTKTNPQKLSKDEFDKAVEKSAKKWKYKWYTPENAYGLDSELGNADVLIKLYDKDGQRAAKMTIDDGQEEYDLFDGPLTPDFSVEDLFAAGDYNVNEIDDESED